MATKIASTTDLDAAAPPATENGIIAEATASVPVNLTGLTRALGLRLVFGDYPEDIAGALGGDDASGYTIYVNARHHDHRQRFTIAHEIGHYMKHRASLRGGTNDTKRYRAARTAEFYNSRIEEQQEREANQFAAALLMPAPRIRDALNQLSPKDPGALAPLFQVSQEAMRYRVENLRQAGEL